MLEKIENEVQFEDSPLWHLFIPAKDSLFGENYYTYILWTLEKLVWYDEFAVRTILLVTINEKNFKFKISNSPENSLYEIFCLWHPQSCLNLNDKIASSKKIIIEYPKTGWGLIKKLLPHNRQHSMNISKPQWHSFETSFEKSITNIEYYNAIDMLLNIMIENFDNNVEHLEIIIYHVEFYRKHFEKINDICVAYANNASIDDCLKICDNLRSKISYSRKYKETVWSMPEDYISKLEELYNKICPDVIDKYKYLFKWNPDILSPIPYDKETFDYGKEQEYMFEIRKEALNNILEKYSLENVIEFCSGAEDVKDLAFIIYEKLFESNLDFALLVRFRDKNIGLYSAIIREAFQNISFDDMLNKLNESSLSEEEKANILCQTTVSVETVEKIDMLEEKVKDYYWSNINIYNVKSFDERELIEIVAKNYLNIIAHFPQSKC